MMHEHKNYMLTLNIQCDHCVPAVPPAVQHQISVNMQPGCEHSQSEWVGVKLCRQLM